MDNKFSNRTTNHTGDVHFEIVSCIASRHPNITAACYPDPSNPKTGSTSPHPQPSPPSFNGMDKPRKRGQTGLTLQRLLGTP